MRRFHLMRIEDESGVSGTGHVAEGVEFTNGLVALTWTPSLTSMSWFVSMDDMIAIHGHEGKTVVEWVD